MKIQNAAYLPSPPRLQTSKELKTSLIDPLFSVDVGEDFTLCQPFFEQLVEKITPPEILEQLKEGISAEKAEILLSGMNKNLPLIHWTENKKKAPYAISVILLTPARFTHGVGRHFADMLNRWLVPGKYIPLSYSLSLDFKFKAYGRFEYFIQNIVLEISDADEMIYIRNNIASLIHEIRLNILAVIHARKIIATRKLSLDEKETLIQENLTSLINRPSKDFDANIYDQMHHFLIKLSAEEKTLQLKEKISRFLEERPNVYSRDIFNEIQNFILLFREKFAAERDLETLTRIISCQYLFKKSLERQLKQDPKQRYLHYKFFKRSKTYLCVLIGINILRENELFAEKHILEALESCLPHLKVVKDSYNVHRKTHDKIRLFYIEVEKGDSTAFTQSEMKKLKLSLPRELRSRFEQIHNPIFMPRNDEEIMRSIILLSQQLKYIQDLPQAVITFDSQSNQNLTFTVIWLRVLRSPSLKELFEKTHTHLKLFDLEVKQAGILRKQWIKEANIFKVSIDKGHFLRKDYSVDLFKARHFLAGELKRILGDFRDFNGGILSKQHEVFLELRQSVNDTDQDFLLENFFFSLSPSINQSILPLELLKDFFRLVLKAIEAEERKLIATRSECLMVVVKGSGPLFKENLFNKVEVLKALPASLTISSVENDGITLVCFLYRTEDQTARTLFLNTID